MRALLPSEEHKRVGALVGLAESVTIYPPGCGRRGTNRAVRSGLGSEVTCIYRSEEPKPGSVNLDLNDQFQPNVTMS